MLLDGPPSCTPSLIHCSCSSSAPSCNDGQCINIQQRTQLAIAPQSRIHAAYQGQDADAKRELTRPSDHRALPSASADTVPRTRRIAPFWLEPLVSPSTHSVGRPGHAGTAGAPCAITRSRSGTMRTASRSVLSETCALSEAICMRASASESPKERRKDRARTLSPARP